MASGVGAVSKYATTVVRLFPDHAGSVIWFSDPVPYDDTRLSARLVDDLRSWEDSYAAGLAADLTWRTPDLATRFHATGARLARRLADEIGDDFQVEHDLHESRRRVRGTGPARNPDAAAAFHRLADDARTAWARLRELADGAARDGTTLEWRSAP